MGRRKGARFPSACTRRGTGNTNIRLLVWPHLRTTASPMASLPRRQVLCQARVRREGRLRFLPSAAAATTATVAAAAAAGASRHCFGCGAQLGRLGDAFHGCGERVVLLLQVKPPVRHRPRHLGGPHTPRVQIRPTTKNNNAPRGVRRSVRTLYMRPTTATPRLFSPLPLYRLRLIHLRPPPPPSPSPPFRRPLGARAGPCLRPAAAACPPATRIRPLRGRPACASSRAEWPAAPPPCPAPGAATEPANVKALPNRARSVHTCARIKTAPRAT